ncbi:MAG: sodium:proton antiporter [Phycisphaerales bacterium]|nr:sodium:proton antiporter [Phycisphaerales bacterium]
MSTQSPNTAQNHDEAHSVRAGKFTIIGAIVAATLAALIALRGLSAHTENLYALVAARPTWIVGCIPFAVLLLCIAIVPMIPALEHWWERNSSKLLVSCALGIAALAWLASQVSVEAAATAAMHGLDEYVPFIILLFSLFVISGGISVGGRFAATPRMNTGILALGAVLANLLGTTGASMLLIRPLLTANSHRAFRAHTVVFFIFVVSNCGGLLLPIGDPPLFLGYLRGVPFEWTLTLWKPWLFVNAAILCVFYVIDLRRWKQEGLHQHRESLTHGQGITLHGQSNGLLLIVSVLAVALVAPEKPLPFIGVMAPNLLREGILVALAGFSLLITPMKIRTLQGFSFTPIGEVAAIFSGLFLAMQIPMAVLSTNGGELGINTPLSFFWITGGLSSVLDNAPTYVVFLEVANTQTPNFIADGVLPLTSGEFVRNDLLAAISCGAVFMGAMTYIGNGPNLMVRAIAAKEGVNMPSFGGYIVWACCVLLPILAAASYLFLR